MTLVQSDINSSENSDLVDAVVLDAAEGQTIALPAKFDLANADGSRAGDDLILTSPDGTHLVIHNFFSFEPPPDLSGQGGQIITGETLAAQFAEAEPVQLAQAAPAAAPTPTSTSTTPIGQVETITGNVVVVRADGSQHTLQVGDQVFQGDDIETGAKSAVSIVFEDQTTFAGGESGHFVLNELVYNPDTSVGSMLLTLLKGAAVIVSGEVAKTEPDAMVVKTPNATMLIRGTTAVINVEGDKTTSTLVEDENGHVGEMVVFNDHGSTTLTVPYQASSVSDLQPAPSPPFIIEKRDLIEQSHGAFNAMIQSGHGLAPTLQNAVNQANQEGANQPQNGDQAPNNPENFETAAGAPTNGAPPTFISVSNSSAATVGAAPAPAAPPSPPAAPQTGPVGGGGTTGAATGGGADDTGDLGNTGGGGNPSGPQPITGTAGNDTLSGTAGNDTIAGNAGNDSLSGLDGGDLIDGGAGNDTIDGGSGDDTLEGGAGDDSVSGGAGNDVIIGGEGAGNDFYDGGTGTDTAVYTSTTQGFQVDLQAQTASGPEIDNDTLTGIENVIGGTGNDSIAGNGADNLLVGGDGNDTLAGRGGDDTLSGGNGVDTADYSEDGAGVNVDLSAETAVGTGVGSDSLLSIENVLGGNGDDTLSGNGAANFLSGGEGDDQLTGGGGNDTLDGGDGTDTAYFAGNRADYTIAPGTGSDLTVTDTVGGRDGIDALNGIDVLHFADGDVYVTGPNHDPTANADVGTTDQDSSVTVDVLANDADPDYGDTPATFSLDSASITGVTGISATSAGTVSIVNDELVFDPNGEFDVLDSGDSAAVTVTYTMSDDQGATSTSTATITVIGVNDDPTANADSGSTNEDTSVTVDVLANDTDPDTNDTPATFSLDGVSITNVSGPAGVGIGAASIVNDQLVFDPNGEFDVLDSGDAATVTISYTMSDDEGATSISTATITVTGTNDNPTAAPDTGTTDQDSSVTIDVLANDSDPDGDDIPSNFSLDNAVIAGVTGLAGTGTGTVSIVSDELVFDPDGAFAELDSGDTATVTIGYTMSDDEGATSISTATITVTGTNDNPTANSDTATTDQNSSVTVDVLANDADPDGGDTPANFSLDSAAITGVTGLSGTGSGTVSIVNDELVFDPNGAFDELDGGDTATVTVTYTMSDDEGAASTATATVTVTGANDAPEANPDTASTSEGVPISIDVLANDTDVDGEDGPSNFILDSAAITGVVGPAGIGTGSVSVSNGELVFDPGTDFNVLEDTQSATVTVTYTMTDDEGAASISTATITVTGQPNQSPTASPDTTTTDEDSSVTVDVLANDADPDPTDTPANFSLDSVSIANVSGPAGIGTGAVSIVNDQLVFDPNGEFDVLDSGDSATVTVTYTMSDDQGATSTSTATITVTGVNDDPTPAPDSGNTDQNSSVTLDVLANDSDPDGDDIPANFSLDSATISGVTGLSGAGTGEVTVSNGELIFNPDGEFDELGTSETATVTITYTMSDDEGASSTSTATITVTGTNDDPMANADAGSTNEGVAVTLDVLANDADPDGSDSPANFSLDSVQIDTVTGPAGLGTGSVAIVNNELVFDPGTDFDILGDTEFATVTISYTMSDDEGAVSSSTATITVSGNPNQSPTANPDTATTDEESSVTVDVLANDTDPDVDDSPANFSLDSVSIANVTGIAATTAGTVTIVNDELVFDPNGDFNELGSSETATVTVAYTMSDDQGATSTSTATITVTGVNDDPEVAVASANQSTQEDTAVQITGLSFTDPDAGQFAASNSYSATLTVAHGDLYDGDPNNGGVKKGFNWVISGTAAQINAALLAVWYVPELNANNDFDPSHSPADPPGDLDSLSLVVEDGAGGVSAAGTVSISVSGVTDAVFTTGADAVDLRESSGFVDDPAAQNPYFEDGNYLDAKGGDDNVVLPDASDALAAQYDGEVFLAGDGNDTITAGSGGNNISGGKGDDSLVGGAGADTLSGGAGNDTLIGGAGDDLLSGGNGDDSVLGGAGNDTLVGGSGLGDDTLDGGTGTDTVTYVSTSQGVEVDLDAGTASGTEIGNDTLIGIENVIGGSGDDTIAGNGADNVIDGGAGSDLYRVSAGNDTILTGGGNDRLDFGTGFQPYTALIDGGGNLIVSFQEAGNNYTVTVEDHLTNPLYELSGQSDDGTYIFRVATNYTASSESTIYAGTIGAETIDAGGGHDILIGNGGNDTLLGGAGNDDFIWNSGDGDDSIEGGAGNDNLQVIGDFTIANHWELNADGSRIDVLQTNAALGIASLDVDGIEEFEFLGGSGADKLIVGDLTGTAVTGNTNFEGGDGADTLDASAATTFVGGYGGAGDDSLVGGTFSNYLEGGAGDDTLVGSTSFSQFFGGAGNDSIVGGTGQDRVNYSGDADAGGTNGVNVNLSTGVAIDGFGGTDTLSGIEEVLGTNQGDTLIGDDGPNYNVLEGLGGNDSIDGGGGFDMISFAHDVDYGGGNGVTVNLGTGSGTATDGFGNTDTFTGIEGVQGTNFADSLTAGDGNNWFRGGGGNDTIDGGNGQDVVSYVDDSYFGGTAGVNVNLASHTATDAFGDTDTLLNIEQVIGTNLNDTIVGDGASNFLQGEGGDDSILGGAGNDVIYGGDGNDYLNGGLGSDILYGGNGVDTLGFEGATVAFSIDLVAGTMTASGGTPVVASGFEAVAAGALDDTILGNDADNSILGHDGNDFIVGGNGNDTLVGGNGDDFLTGKVGNDTILGGNGNDTIFGGANNDLINGGNDTDTFSVLGGPTGFTIDLGAGTSVANSGPSDNDTLIGIENADGSNFDDSITGTIGDNFLTGQNGDDSLVGLNGNDTIFGGFGNDTLVGGNGDDSLRGNVGNDTILGGAGNDYVVGGSNDDLVDGGDGIDTYSVLGAPTGFTIDLVAGTAVASSGPGDSDTLVGIENAEGSLFDDTIAGSDEANLLDGGNGNDSLTGGIGDDTLIGGNGDDTIYGGAGNDSLLGGAGNDLLAGGLGVDTFEGGAGDDTLTARSATVALEVNLKAGLAGLLGQTLTDSVNDVENVNGGTLGDSLTGDDGGNEIIGFEGDDTIVGGNGADSLVGWADNDVIYGGNGDDSLYGDTSVTGATHGNDFLDGGAGNDLLVGSGFDDTLLGDDGNDTLIGDDSLAGTVQGNDSLVGGNGNDSIIGGDGNDWIVGNAGQDTLYGGNGIDSLSGGGGVDHIYGGGDSDFLFSGGGNDVIDGGDGFDRIDYSKDADFGGLGAVNVNLGANTATDGFNSIDTITNVESVRATQLDDTLVGSDNSGSIYLERFQGLAGGDDIDGGAGFDEVDYATDEQFGARLGIIADFSNGTVIDGFGDTDILTSIEAVRGSIWGDSLTGSDNSASPYYERFTGLAGDDTIDGGAGFDQIDYWYDDKFGAAHGVNFNFATGIATDGFDGTDTFTNIEAVRGSDLADTLTGSDNSASPYYERFEGLKGNDSIDGGAGYDQLRYDFESRFGGTQGVNVDLEAHTATDTYGDTDTIFNIEEVIATQYDDTLLGANDSGVYTERLYGGDGDDSIDGRAGVDYLDGGNGNDILVGGDGNDSLFGRNGHDTLYGGNGDDFLVGGPGNDTLDGGNGVDTYSVLGAPIGIDINLALGQSGAVGGTPNNSLANIENAIGSDFDDSLTGTSGANRLEGNGGNDTIVGGDGNDLLFGGIGDDSLVGGEGDDLVVAGGNGDDTLRGGNGDDTLGTYGDGPKIYDGGAGTDLLSSVNAPSTLAINVNLATGEAGVNGGVNGTVIGIENVLGGAGNDTLIGNGSDNLLDGQNGNDSLVGGNGDDTLFGRGGLDVLYGGNGNDLLGGGPGADTIYGGSGNDTLTVAGADAGVAIDLDGGTVGLVGGATIDSIFSIEHAIGSNYDDYINGSNVANLIYGGGGNDTLIGNGGNDTLYGGAGNDSLNGGFGDDFLDGGSGIDTLGFEGANVAFEIDLVNQTMKVNGTGTPDTIMNFEDAYGGAFNDTILGNGADNLFRGNGGNDSLVGAGGDDTLIGGDGDDELYGGAGNDSLNGGFGDDFLDGGSGIDTLGFEGANVAFEIDLVNQTMKVNGTGTPDTIINFEDVYGGAYNDTILGNGADNLFAGNNGDDSLVGGDGSDTLIGGDGNDELYGGAGNDYLAGGFGADTLDGGTGIDTYTVRFAPMGIAIDLLYGGSDTIISIENIEGSLNYDDTLLGDNGDNKIVGHGGNDSLTGRDGNDTLVGGNGNDTLLGGNGADSLLGGNGDDYLGGGAGADTLDGGDGFDVVSYKTATVDFTIDLAAMAAKPSASGPTDVLIGIEGALGGDGNDMITGNGSDNLLIGYNGNDTLIGGAGDDTLFGKNGDDSILGGAGNDVIGPGTGADFLDGGDGIDTLVLTNATVALDIDMTTTSFGPKTFQNFENLIGGGFNDTLTGDGGANLIDGGNGDDIIHGGGGNDTLIGDPDGNDVLHGDAGNDLLVGTFELYGGVGDDTLIFDVTGQTGTTDVGGTVKLDGGAGDDVIDFTYQGQALTTSTATITAGSGNNMLDFSLEASIALTTATNSAHAFVHDVTLHYAGGGGADTVAMSFLADASQVVTTAFASASANLSANNINIDLGNGDNVLDLSINAHAEAIGTASATAQALISGNKLSIVAGTGADSIDISIGASAVGGTASSAIAKSNTLTIDLGANDDHLTLNLDVALGSNNQIKIIGGAGSDTIDINGGSTNTTLYYSGTGDLGDTVSGFDASLNNFAFAVSEFNGTDINADGILDTGSLFTGTLVANQTYHFGYYASEGTYKLFYSAAGVSSTTTVTNATLSGAVEVADLGLADVGVTENNIHLTTGI